MRIEHLKTLMHAFENEISLRKETLLKEEDGTPKNKKLDSIHMDCLKRIAGFFAISLSLHHNLPELFPMSSLKEMWNTAQISL